MKLSGILFLVILALSLGLIVCSSVEEQINPTSSKAIDFKNSSTKNENDYPDVIYSANAQVTLRGPTVWGTYTVQIIQNGVVRWQNTNVILYGGYRTITVYGLPDGCGYIGKAWINAVGSQSNTWPSKCISGTTHLGCLEFNMGGEPSPWQGSCP